MLKWWHPVYIGNYIMAGMRTQQGQKRGRRSWRKTWRHWLFLWKSRPVAVGSPIKPSQQSSIDGDAVPVSARRALSVQKYLHRVWPPLFWDKLVLGELGGEEGTALLRALSAPGVCLEWLLRKAGGIPEVTASLHSAVIHRLTPMCRGYLQLLQCPEQGLGKETWDVQCLLASSGKNTKAIHGPGGFGPWGAVIHQAALSFPPLFFHSWTAFKTLARASQHGGKDKSGVRGLFWCWRNKTVGSLMQALWEVG